MIPNTRAMTWAGAATGDMSTATPTTDAIAIKNAWITSFEIVVSGSASPVGTVKLQLSNDSINWVDALGISQAISADVLGLFEIERTAMTFARLVYTRVSGTGTIAASCSTKESA